MVGVVLLSALLPINSYQIAEATRGGVTCREGAGEKFHSGGRLGKAFFDMEPRKVSRTQL